MEGQTIWLPRKLRESSPPKNKMVKSEDQEGAAGGEGDNQKAGSMKEFLEEANKMLRSLSTSGSAPSCPPSVAGGKKDEEDRDEVVERLQQ